MGLGIFVGLIDQRDYSRPLLQKATAGKGFWIWILKFLWEAGLAWVYKSSVGL